MTSTTTSEDLRRAVAARQSDPLAGYTEAEQDAAMDRLLDDLNKPEPLARIGPPGYEDEIGEEDGTTIVALAVFCFAFALMFIVWMAWKLIF